MRIKVAKTGKICTLTLVFAWWACNRSQVIYPERKDIIETVYASGKIVPNDEYKLAVLVSGTITSKLVREGDTVTKGQILYVIKNDAAKERYEAALKSYQNLQTNLSERSPLLKDLELSLQNAAVKCTNDSIIYHRYKKLWAQDIGTRNNLDNVYASYQLSLNQKQIAQQKYYSAVNDLNVEKGNARSQVTAARESLKEYFVKSDRNGVVYQTFKEAGETVWSNEVVAMLGGHSNQLLRLSVDQQDVYKIKTGQQVLLQSDVTGNTVYEARVTCIYPVMNEQDQTFRVDACFINKPSMPYIHSSVEANVVIQNKQQALVLPRNALVGNDSVWIMNKRNKIKVRVKTGITTLDHVEVLSGLNEKTPVLLITQKDKP